MAADAPIAGHAGLPRIRILATGGTIAGTHAHGTDGAYTAGSIPVEALVAAVPGLEALARLETETVAAIGSQDMDESVWRRLAARLAAARDDPAIAGVVVTHGTDTIEETAWYLDLVLRRGKPVVLVGAMRAATAADADGPRNLRDAVAVAADPASADRGVLVVACGEIHSARQVTKVHTTRLDAFRSLPGGPAGALRGGLTHYREPAGGAPEAPEFGDPQSPLPRVGIVHAHAGMDATAIDAFVAAGFRGIVIAGVGAGNLGAAALAAAASAARAGIAIVRSSRTGDGPVSRGGEVDDDWLGFVAAGGLNPQKARVLLMLALTRTSEPAELQRLYDAF